MDLEEAKTIVEKHGGWPPATEDARANFMLDVAQNQVMDQPPLFGETLELSDWEDKKDLYEEEAEINEHANTIDTYSVQELKEKYL